MTSIALSQQRRALLEKLLGQEGLRPGNGDGITPREHFGPVPLSFAQQRLWFLQQLEPDSYVYNIPVGLRIEGPLNVVALEHGINQIICRHESLRTTYKVVNGQALQIVNPPFKLQLSLDAVQIAAGPQQKEIARRAGKELRRPFDLAAGPLLRAKLLRFAANDHVLLLTMHHIVADGWSIGVFLRDLGIFYDSYLQKKQPDLPPLAIQYADFAIWQRQEKHNAAVAAEIAWWKQQLDGIPSLVQLPADHPRHQRATFQGEHIPFLIPKGLEESLTQLGRSEGATLFITLLAAFNVLLYRYSGQEDIAIGTPVAQRNRPEIEDLIGFFVNTLVLRTRLSGAFTFRELLRNVKEVSLGAFAHQDAPFEKVIEELHPERSLGHSPLFQIMLDLQTAPMELPQIKDLRLNLLPIDTQTAKFDLALTLSPTGEGLDAALEYRTDIFEEATARRIVANFVTLLEAIVEQPESRISRLSLLAGAEKKDLMQEWNNTELKFKGAALVHRMFEQQAQRIPAELSVTCGDRTLRYAQLNRRSNQLARHLQRLGVGPESLIGVCLERSAQMPLAILAVLKAGGAYVPLDPAYPPERLAFMMKDAQLQTVITNSALRSYLKETHVQPICLDIVSDAIAAESEENCQTSPLLDNAAYVIYTSGSTGSPKGIIVSHRNLIQSTLSRTAYYREPVHALLLLPSFSFDSSIAGLFWTLSQGGKLVVPEETSHQDVVALVQLIERHSVSHLLCLPALYRLLLEQQGHGLNSLRTVVVAGEPCPADLISLHHERLPHASLFNEYGPTEATVWSTVFNCSSAARWFTVPIGRPIANTKVYLLDRHSQPVPVGATGELYIGGDGISRGYLNRPELTAERFVPDSFSRTPGARLYKTGDLGRHLHDGNLEFKGRNDFQVKVRGYRIEPGEIEMALAQHPSVHQAAVVADDKGLKAFVKLRPEANTDSVELRSFLKNKLPDYMVPGSFIFLDLFPLTPTGKVDRKALIQIKASDSRHIQEYAAPQTALEQVLAAIFADVLGAHRIGLLDNFFEMGGHSLMATQVASRVHEALRVDLPLRRIFEMPTVELLANAILNETSDPLRVQRTAELLLRLSHVSDEEAEALLEKNLVSRGQLT